MQQDPLDRLADTRDGLDHVAQRFETARAAMQEATGSDDTGEVTVRMSPDGELVDLILGSRWQTKLEPAGFGAAVLQAYAQAGLASSEQWAGTVGEQVDGPEPTTRPMASSQESTYARLEELASPATLAARSPQALAALADLLRQANRDFDAVLREAEDVAGAQHVGESRGTKVTVSGAGILIGVEVDLDWATRAHGASLAQHTMKAYQEARRKTRGRTIDDVVDQSIFGEVRRLAEDPEALASRIGLT